MNLQDQGNGRQSLTVYTKKPPDPGTSKQFFLLRLEFHGRTFYDLLTNEKWQERPMQRVANTMRNIASTETQCRIADMENVIV